ncbi:MAG: PEGA domain-containing protein [Deltaproteobacteria bacterium]|nr:PEGA domain-containing protein [Deltaproteobacteria bacterium]
MTTPVAVESRAPGSSLVLPANPLMNLTDQSLGGFVDCALYEETGNFFRAPGYEDSLVDIDPVAPPPETLAPVNAIRQGPSTGAPPMLSPKAFAPRELPPEQQFTPEATPLPMLAPKRDATPPRYSQPLVTDDGVPVDAPSASLSSAPAPAPASSPVPSPRPSASVSTPIHSTASHPEMPASGRRTWILIGGAAAIAASLVLVMVLSRGGEDEAKAPPVKVASADPPAPAQPELTPPPVPAVATSDVTNPAPVEPPPDRPVTDTTPDETEPSGGPPVVGSGPCRVTVTSTPAGSIVRIDDQVIGPSPITFDGPCKRRKVDVKHPRYALGTKFVNLVPDKPTTVEVPLARPTHAITIMTMPPGATISIAGNRAGTTPTSVKIMGFTGVTLTVEKKGYKTVVQKVYSKVDQDRITLKLVRGN